MTITDLINGHRTALQQHDYALREIAPLAEQLCTTLGLHMMLSRPPDSEPMHQLSFWPNEVARGNRTISHCCSRRWTILGVSIAIPADHGSTSPARSAVTASD